jgi:hypothetical protein
MAEAWANWIGAEAAKVYEKFGYYSFKLESPKILAKGEVRVIGLNT